MSDFRIVGKKAKDEYAITIEMEDKDKCCPWYDMCIYKTATCRVRYPDNGCVLYRWFKELMSKEDNNGIHEA